MTRPVTALRSCKDRLPASLPGMNTTSSGLTVLIADDGDIVRRHLVALVAAQPQVGRVLQASSQKMAITLLEQEQPDVAFLDSVMPGGSGLELLAAARRCCPTTRLIMLMEEVDEFTEHRYHSAGVDGCCLKGCDLLAQLVPPDTDAHCSAPDGTVTLAQPASPLSVLLVDDDAFMRRTMRRQLADLGVQAVTEAADGHEGLAALDSPAAAFDLIFCDLAMPDMDGMAFIRELSRRQQRPALSIVSSRDQALLGAVGRMCRSYGVDLLDIIAKPASSDRLALLLEALRPGAAPPAAATDDKATEFSPDEILAALRRGEIVPYFQPRVELRSGRIAGAEALARWLHPQHGLLTPQPFFVAPLEAIGQLGELTLFMIRAAASQCAIWRKRGADLDISVNVSLSCLRDPEISRRILEALEAAELPAEKLTLEITETGAMTDAGPALENLTRLRMHGLHLAIDDFGTGYASFEQLSNIPFTEIKIDRSFVAGMQTRPEDKAIVDACLELARRFSLRVVAEGVEDHSCATKLAGAGCDLAQGFYYSRAVPAVAFEALLGTAA